MYKLNKTALHSAENHHIQQQHLICSPSAHSAATRIGQRAVEWPGYEGLVEGTEVNSEMEAHEDGETLVEQEDQPVLAPRVHRNLENTPIKSTTFENQTISPEPTRRLWAAECKAKRSVGRPGTAGSAHTAAAWRAPTASDSTWRAAA